MVFRSATWLLGLVVAAQAWAQAPSPPTAIYIMKADGSDVRELAQVEGYEDHEAPQWSHDGKRLTFDARNRANRARSCFVVNADGSGLREIAKGRFADWSPDDRQIAFQLDAADGTAEIYVQNLDGQGLTKIANGRCPRWSNDGSVLVFSERTMLRAVDLLSDEERTLLAAPVVKVFDGFTFSPDGKTMAVVVRPSEGARRQLFFIDPAADNEGLTPRLENEMGGFTSFSPDGKQLVFSDAMRIRLVDVAGDARPRKIAGLDGSNRHPAFSPDGKQIAFSGSVRTVKPGPPQRAAMPTAKTLEEVRRHDRRSRVWSLDFTPDGRNVVLGGAGNNGPQVWDLTTGETRDLGGRGMLIGIFPDGKRFLTSWVRAQAHIIDIASGDVLREFVNDTKIWGLHLSRDGRRLLIGGIDRVIHIYDVATGKPLVAFDPTPDYFTRAMFTPDGKEVIAGCNDKMLRIWDAETGKQRLAIEHPDAVWGLAVTPDGRYILTGTGGSLTGNLTLLQMGPGNDNVLRMWDRETGKLVREMKGHDEIIFDIDVSPDGRLAVTGSADSTMRLWDLSTGDEVSKIGPGKGLVACVRFSPDGKLIVAGGGVAAIQGRVVEFPTEQVRVYKVLDAATQTAEPAADKPVAEKESE